MVGLLGFGSRYLVADLASYIKKKTRISFLILFVFSVLWNSLNITGMMRSLKH